MRSDRVPGSDSSGPGRWRDVQDGQGGMLLQVREVLQRQPVPGRAEVCPSVHLQ